MIDVQDMVYRYARSTSPALQSLSFTVQPGEIFGFLGPSGAGKSTTQKLLIGLLDGYQGHIRVFGRELTDWNRAYYKRIGVSFELPNHYLKLSALENLAYFRALYSDQPTYDPHEVLVLVGLDDDGDKPVAQFSKGMKNRLNLARALLHRPELLFLDEPTAGLDPVNTQRIKDLIAELQECGTTIFLTTHDMSVADQVCDRVAFLVAGEIALIDTPRALRLRYGQRVVRVEYGQNSNPAACDFALDGLGNDDDFLDLIRTQTIQTIHTQETTLEQIFIEVTGHSL